MTEKSIPVAANTLAVGVMGLDLQEGIQVPRRRVFAWALYDWATQPFNTVLLTFVWVPSYLTSTFFVDPAVIGTAREEAALGQLASNLGYGITVAGLLIALLAPVLGQRADRAGRQKLQLLVFTALLVVAQLGLAFVQPGAEWFWMGVALIAVGQHLRRDRRGQLQRPAHLGLDAQDDRQGLGPRLGLRLPRRHRRPRDRRRADPRRRARRRRRLDLPAHRARRHHLDGRSSSIPIFLSVPEPPKLAAAEKVGFFRSYVELVRGVQRLYRETRPTFWFLLA